MFAPEPGKTLPLENTVQEDLQDYLEEVDMEATDRSGGCADMDLAFPRPTTFSKCKRTTGRTARKGLRR